MNLLVPGVDPRLERFAGGDLAAFESLFREFQGTVYGWIVRVVRDRQAAEELTIESFWRIYRARARFDPQRSFGAWARRIATNVAIDYLEHNPKQLALVAEPSAEPVYAAVQRETREKIARAFRELPAKLQAAATLALVEEESYDQIADQLDISVAAVKSRVFRAVRMLRSKLERMGIEP
jgi:RNA polymerase sigma-70 factor (ECF subfamily)